MVPASDMNMLYWSDELAASAQRHANTCDFRHSRGRRNVGENIWAAPYSNYSDAIALWFNEVHNPRCACNHAYKHCCGHYVQVVWAKTNLVGCGFARCRDVQGVLGRGHRNVFVCHYNPQGNTVFVTGSGQLYAVGGPSPPVNPNHSSLILVILWQ
ncbi:SCP-like protein [Teladorsagia circumcincta]|uniref:SCP-like protein n=1 Tax=Teladorsagia circumcincta TaxID=45464 RepID=A0A2G9UAE9_TELCI|nr:SCP-like protein [Teladorsagia circumcincta]